VILVESARIEELAALTNAFTNLGTRFFPIDEHESPAKLRSKVTVSEVVNTGVGSGVGDPEVAGVLHTG